MSAKYLDHNNNSTELPHNDFNHYNHNYHKHGYSNNFRNQNNQILTFCFLISTCFTIIEAIGGYITNSIALKSDALHMLTDSIGLLIAIFANKISQKAANNILTYGYGKAEAIGSLINAIFTLILTIGLLIEVITRFFKPITINSIGLFIIASIGLIVNLIVAYLLSKAQNSLNIKAVLIHTLGDVLASIIAIVAGVIIYYTGFNLADPLLSLIVIIILIVSNFNLIKHSIIVLMGGVPDYINYEQVGQDLETINGVLEIHDLHIWYMSTNQTALSAHLIIKCPNEWGAILSEAQHMLITKHNIHHITLQHEFCHNNTPIKNCDS